MGSKTQQNIRQALDRIGRFVVSWGGIMVGLSLAMFGAAMLVWATRPELINLKRLPGPNDVWIALGLIVSGLNIANFSRMIQIWSRMKRALNKKPHRRSKEDSYRVRRGFRELFIYVFLTFGAMTALAYLSADGHGLISENVKLFDKPDRPASTAQLYGLLGTLGFTLVPLLAGFYLHARHEQNDPSIKRALWRSDAVSPSTFWAGALILSGIFALAKWAADASMSGSEAIAENLTFLVTIAVVCLFVAFIFVPHIARFFSDQADRRVHRANVASAEFPVFTAPAIFASWVDSLLVRLIAPLSGATQRGRGVPHGFVILFLLPLTALGFVLKAPYGLVPIGLGMLIVVSLGRRWAWIEEDRETASRLMSTDNSEINVGFDNDLKDEALLGYAFLFVLVPLALYQINGVTHVFGATEGSAITNPFLAWLSFFGAELAKAVPFVDWWEIYAVDMKPAVKGLCVSTLLPCSDGQDIFPLAKHLTFASRAMVDLVIMAALFQAIGIWQRGRAQRRLFDIGQVNHFDPFMEKDFFQQAFLTGSNRPKPEFERKVRAHVQARELLRQPSEPYSPERLADLIRSDNKAVQRTALWMVREFNLLAGAPREKIRQLTDQWNNISFPQLSANNAIQARTRLINEKHKFEHLLSELIENYSELRQSDVGLLVGQLEAVRATPEFAFAQIEALRLLSCLRGNYALLALASHVVTDSDTAGMALWRKRINNEFGRSAHLRLGQAPMRLKVVEALERFGLNPPSTPGIKKRTVELLRLLSIQDPATPVRDRAVLAAKRIDPDGPDDFDAYDGESDAEDENDPEDVG